MRTNRVKKFITGSVMFSLIVGGLPAFAAELVLNPAYITGQFNIPGVTPSRYQVSAQPLAGGSESYVYSEDGTYTLTVGVPENASADYRMSAVVWTNDNQNRMLWTGDDITVQDGQTRNYDFNIETGRIDGTLTVTGESLRYGVLFARNSKNQWRAHGYVDSEGNFSFPTTLTGEVRLDGYIYLGNGDSMNIVQRTIYVTPGETTTQEIAVDLGSVSGTVNASVNMMSNSNNGIVTQINRTDSYMTRIEDGTRKLRRTYAGEAGFQFDSLMPGTWRFSPYTRMWMNDGNDDYIQLPERVHGPEVNIVAGSVVDRNIDFDVAAIKGNIALSGSKGWDDVYSATVGVYGAGWYDRSQEDSANYGGYAEDNVNTATGDYDSVVTDGDWRFLRTIFVFRDVSSTDPEDYLYSQMRMQDYSDLERVTLAPGEVVENKNFHFKTGTIRINLSAADGADIASAYAWGGCYDPGQYRVEPFAYSYINAYGSNQPVANAALNIVAPPLPCRLQVRATVGGSAVNFGFVEFQVDPGADVVLDIGGPQLAVTSPGAESYTTADNIEITGTVTDDNGVAEVVVNGSVATLTSTNNPDDPNEVTFSASVSLQGGPNTITTVATDTAGKQGSDARTIYRDAHAPELSWTPANGAALPDSMVIVDGTASDDNVITTLKVNGADVVFASTNNPADPNEVAFSTALNLELGTHQIVVSASDNSRRTTTQTHTVERVDNRPPGANAGADQILECSGVETNVSLSGTASSDPDGDVLSYLWSGSFGAASGENVTIPFTVASHTVTLNVSDGKGGNDNDSVVINVVDTTAPLLNIPAGAEIQLEASSPTSTPYALAFSASDACGNAVATAAPNVAAYPLGDTIVTVTATDDNGQSASQDVTVSVVDTTPPTFDSVKDVTGVEATSTSGAVVSYSAPTASDIADASVDVSCTPLAGSMFGLGKTSVTCTAIDDAGNSTQTAFDVEVVDTTAPNWTTAPADIDVVATGELTAVDLGAVTADDFFGPVTVAATLNGQPAPNGFPVGTHTVTWTATDTNGNVAELTQTVRVQYAFGGFKAPLRDGGVYKKGRVIPVKVVLTYADGTPVATATPTLAVFKTSSQEVAAEPEDINSASAADSGNTMRYVDSDGQYIYNLDTTFASKGTYRVVVELNDGSTARYIDIAFK